MRPFSLILILALQVCAASVLKKDSIYLITPFFCDNEEVYGNTLESIFITSFPGRMKLNTVSLSGDTSFLSFYRRNTEFSSSDFAGYLDKGIRYVMIVSYRNRLLYDDHKEVPVSLKKILNFDTGHEMETIELPAVAGKEFVLKTIVSCSVFDLSTVKKVGVFQAQVANKNVKVEKMKQAIYGNFRKVVNHLKIEFRKKRNWIGFLPVE